LAKIKLKVGDNEIEVDSRDFYVDNQTLGEVIELLSDHMPKNQAKVTYEPITTKTENETDRPIQNGLEFLDNAEAFEPEFNKPQYIAFPEIKAKLQILEASRFFDSPRTVTEIVEQLREYGWAASPLDVSKSLVKMASNKEIMKDSYKNRTHYFVQESFVAN
jgi:hypothetical protein